MRTRKGFLLLFAAALLALLLNEVQTRIYLNAPEPKTWTKSGSEDERLTYSLLVAGAGLDLAELATGLRDLERARFSILKSYPGRHIIRTLHPKQAEYSAQTFKTELAKADGAERLILYLTGHGGGFNFGATSKLNLRRELIFEELSQIEVGEAWLVVDCCWSGRFAETLEKSELDYPLTLITSTDAEHPAPFPVSFLSPKSFGAMWFDQLPSGEKQAFDNANTLRGKLAWLFPGELGLVGQWRETK